MLVLVVDSDTLCAATTVVTLAVVPVLLPTGGCGDDGDATSDGWGSGMNRHGIHLQNSLGEIWATYTT